MRLRNQWLLLSVTLILKLCTFFVLCLALYVQPKSLHHDHEDTENAKHASNILVFNQPHKKDFSH